MDSTFLDRVRQLVSIVGQAREMLGKQSADPVDRMHHRLSKILRTEVYRHGLDKLVPELVAATLMDSFVANHGELLRTRRDKDQNAVALARRRHPEFFKLRAGGRDRVVDVAVLHIDAHFAGGQFLSLTNRPNDASIIQSSEK